MTMTTGNLAVGPIANEASRAVLRRTAPFL